MKTECRLVIAKDWRGGEGRGGMKCSISFWGDETVLKSDHGDSGPTLSIH